MRAMKRHGLADAIDIIDGDFTWPGTRQVDWRPDQEDEALSGVFLLGREYLRTSSITRS